MIKNQTWMKIRDTETQPLIWLESSIGRVNVNTWRLKWELFSKYQGSVEVASIEWCIFWSFDHIMPLENVGGQWFGRNICKI